MLVFIIILKYIGEYFMIIIFLFLCFLNVELLTTVHIFGDSHAVSSFCNQGYEAHTWGIEYKNKLILVPYSIHWMGPMTMYRVGRDGLGSLNITKYNVKEGDTAVFVFGEIDARCHIGKQRDKKNVLLNDIIDPLIQNYLEAIKQNIQLYKNINCIIFNILPSTEDFSNSVYPYYSTLEDRAHITKACNKKLQELCPMYGFKFLDVYDLYTDDKGKLNSLIGDSSVHLNLHYNYPIKKGVADLIDLEKYRSEFIQMVKKD